MVRRDGKIKQASGKEGRREGKTPSLFQQCGSGGGPPSPSLFLASICVIIGIGSTLGRRIRCRVETGIRFARVGQRGLSDRH